MTSKNATLICLYKGKIHPLYDIEKKISQSFELNETNIQAPQNNVNNPVSSKQYIN